MLRTLSQLARQWEPYAVQLRKLAGCGLYDLLDPYEPAPKISLTVVDGPLALRLFSVELQQYLRGKGSNHRSGGVVDEPLADGTFICILKPFHPPRKKLEAYGIGAAALHAGS